MAAADLHTQISQFWQQEVETGFFLNSRGLRLAYACCCPAQPSGVLVIANGRTESYLKYQEIFHWAYQQNLEVWALDHRGQGLSERLCDDSEVGYVTDFEDYIEDLHYFVEQVMQIRDYGKRILLGHSMGGAIAALYQLRHPDYFTHYIYCSPMFGIRSPIPKWLAKTIVNCGAWLNAKLSNNIWYCLGQGPYVPMPFKLNVLTHCPDRYQWFRELYDQQPKLRLGGVSYLWLVAAQKAMNEIASNSDRLNGKQLLVQAGGDDIVDNAKQDVLVTNQPHIEKVVIDEGKHELLIESDQYRLPALAAISQFIENS